MSNSANTWRSSRIQHLSLKGEELSASWKVLGALPTEATAVPVNSPVRVGTRNIDETTILRYRLVVSDQLIRVSSITQPLGYSLLITQTRGVYQHLPGPAIHVELR